MKIGKLRPIYLFACIASLTAVSIFADEPAPSHNKDIKQHPLEYKVTSRDSKIVAGFYQDGWDEVISIRDAKTGKEIRRIVGHGDTPTAFNFTRDGKYLASSCPRNGFALWDVATGKELLRLPAHKTPAKEKIEKTPPVVWFGHWSRGETHKVFKELGSRMGPTETRLNSAEDAAKVFKKDVYTKLMKGIDFKKQDMMIVRSSGSGRNKLRCYYSESKPPKVMFVIEPGSTKDLVDQIHVFAVRKDVKSAREAHLRRIRNQ